MLTSTLTREELTPTQLSSGEQHELVLFYELLFRLKPDSLVLIDEPEISLHPDWQLQFLDDLKKIIELSPFDALVATHSPLIIGERWDLAVAFEAEKDSCDCDAAHATREESLFGESSDAGQTRRNGADGGGSRAGDLFVRAPNAHALAIISAIRKRREGKALTQTVDSRDYLHQARAGGMYGYGAEDESEKCRD